MLQTGEKNFLQAVLQDAEDQLRVLAFLLRHAQQHAPVRPGILGERGVGLVRGVLRGVLLAERFVDAGDAGGAPACRGRLFFRCSENRRLRAFSRGRPPAARWRAASPVPAPSSGRPDGHTERCRRVRRRSEKAVFRRQRFALRLCGGAGFSIAAAGAVCALITRLQTRCVCFSVSGCMGSPSFAPLCASRRPDCALSQKLPVKL